MYENFTVEKRCQKILEDNGQMIADKANKILLDDSALKGLKAPLEFISKNWRDPLTPALMSLSCEAVGGRPERTHDVALAMSLMNLSVYLWDDIIDKATIKLFKPTLFGKFGEGIALIVGGLATAKAFSILGQIEEDKAKLQTITKMFWGLWTRVAQAEMNDLRLRTQKKLTSKDKLQKITMEASNLEVCLKIGALIGDGSTKEISHLGKYGKSFGIILELWKDFQVSTNLTLELSERIRCGALPYSLLWASERSVKIQGKLLNSMGASEIEQGSIKGIVKEALQVGMLENTLKTIDRFSKKAISDLEGLKNNNACQLLQLLVEDQHCLFVRSLPSFVVGV
jgi:geranylgeranyl pyrophosphate synthase